MVASLRGRSTSAKEKKYRFSIVLSFVLGEQNFQGLDNGAQTCAWPTTVKTSGASWTTHAATTAVTTPAPPWRHSPSTSHCVASARELQVDMEPQTHHLFLRMRHVTASELRVVFTKRVSVAQQPETKTLVT